MFEIEASIFGEYLNKVTLGGSISSCILRAGKDGMESTVATTDNVTIVKAILPRNMFSKYTEDITFPLSSTGDQGDVNLISKIINKYSGKLTIVKDNNVMRLINGDDEAIVTLSSEDFVDNDCKKMPQLEFDNGFVIDKSVLSKAVANLATIKGKNELPPVQLNIKDKVMVLVVKNNQTTLSSKIKVDYKDGIVNINGNYFEKIVNIVSDKVNISFEPDMPILITDKTEKALAKYIIAPVITEE